jgi:hypothetical protein
LALIKCMSIWVPWAQLIMDGKKTTETRSWRTHCRGTIAIHAAMTVNATVRENCVKFGYNVKAIPKGAVLGTANLYDCVQFPDPRAPPDAYGDFTPGRWGWLLKDVVKFDPPIPIKGHQGLWNFEMPEGLQ